MRWPFPSLPRLLANAELLMRKRILLIVTAVLVPFPSSAQEQKLPDGMVRIASGVSGHIHPAACVAKSGTVVVIFSQADFKDLRLCRSIDGGRTWTKPLPVPPTEKLSIYPGAVTALAGGRIMHAWNTWYTDSNKKK